MITAAATAATAADAGDGALYWFCSIFTAAAAAPGAPAAAPYCWCATKNHIIMPTGTLCLMRLWYKKGTILPRTGNTIWEVKGKMFTDYVLKYYTELESKSDD